MINLQLIKKKDILKISKEKGDEDDYIDFNYIFYVSV